MAIGDTYAPALGQPSLSAGEITSLYQKYIGRAPDAGEIASELENANKYSAAGIERQIALRGGNAAGSGVRGDEALPALTIPRPVMPAPAPAPVYTLPNGAVDFRSPLESVPVSGGDWREQITHEGAPLGSIANFGAGGTLDTAFTGGPVGLAHQDYGNVVPGRTVVNYGNTGAAPILDMAPQGASAPNAMTWIILAGMAVAAWYLLKG